MGLVLEEEEPEESMAQEAEPGIMLPLLVTVVHAPIGHAVYCWSLT